MLKLLKTLLLNLDFDVLAFEWGKFVRVYVLLSGETQSPLTCLTKMIGIHCKVSFVTIDI